MPPHDPPPSVEASPAMKKLRVLSGLGLPALGLCWLPTATRGEEKKAEYKPFGTIERKDKRFDKLIAPDVKAMEDLAGGFDRSEGPVWGNKDGGYLLCPHTPKHHGLKRQGGH